MHTCRSGGRGDDLNRLCRAVGSRVQHLVHRHAGCGKAVMRGSGSLYVVDTKSTGSYNTAGEYKRGYRTASQVTGYL